MCQSNSQSGNICIKQVWDEEIDGSSAGVSKFVTDLRCIGQMVSEGFW